MKADLVDTPEGWACSRLGDVLQVSYGKGLIESNRRPGTVPVYGSNGVVGFHDKPLINGPAIVIGRKGTVGAVHLSSGPCWPIDTTYFIDDFPTLDPQFVLHALRSMGLAGLDTSSAIPGLNRDELYDQPLLIPPLAEQKRIVAKVEKLLARVNAARERLARVPAILKRFRQSVLAAACSGRLTADWREHHAEVEPASERWSIKSDPIEIEDLPELPETWSYRRLKEIAERVSVGHVGPTSKYYCAASEGIPFIRSQNVRPSRLVLDDVQHITRSFHETLRKSQLLPGDLLVVRVGANRGDTCIVPKNVGPLNCANVVFARPFQGISDHLGMYCQSKLAQDLLLEMTTGSAQGVLNTTSVAELPVPIPPTAEQKEILERAHLFLEIVDVIEERLKAGRLRAGGLTQAILAKAFRGELVPTEADLARAKSSSVLATC